MRNQAQVFKSDVKPKTKQNKTKSKELTAEHVGANVGGASTLVLEKVSLTQQMFAEAEVGDGHTVRALVQHHVPQLKVSMDNVLLPIYKDETLLYITNIYME